MMSWVGSSVLSFPQGKGTFKDLSELPFPFTCQRCFFGSEHGKGESDGETGVMSQAIRRAVYSGQNFKDAKDIADFMTRTYGSTLR